MTRFKTETWAWKEIPEEWTKRFSSFVSLWLGTPYMPGVRVRGVGTDCAQLVPAFLDHMYRSDKATPIPRMAGDTGVHNFRAAWGTVKAVRLGYPSFVVRDGTIEPGDIIITRASHNWQGPRRPGHAMIAMRQRGTALHAVPVGGVTITSIAATRGGIVRVYRLEEKHTWA